jgi:arabinogalactan oligomer/maltooligosaccharide transport system permease protein
MPHLTLSAPIRANPETASERTAGRAWLRVLAVVAVVALAAALRWRAIERLPIDFDEDDYLRAAQQYAVGLQAGDWSVFTRENYRPEHPPLSKIVYGFAIAGLPPTPEIPDRSTTAPPAASLPRPHLTYARVVSALFNVAAVALLALLNPLAGLLLAVQTMTIKYSSQVMLEGVPTLTSLLVVVAYLQAQKPGAARWRWLAVSAVALGLTAAAKYPFALVGVTVGAYWLWGEWRAHGPSRALVRALGPLAMWGAVAVAIFFFADPYLWPDPINRLLDSLLYHQQYAQSAPEVQQANFPIWQPLGWLMLSAATWHSNVFLIVADLPITFFALLGLRRAWERQPLFVVWFGVALAFLFAWTTKWPQYVIMLMAPLCVIAAHGLQATVWKLLQRWWQAGRPVARERNPLRETLRALPWLLPGALTLILLAGYPLVYQAAVALTDFNALAIRDGMTGGVWREVWLGLTGQVEPVRLGNVFEGGVRSREVSYAGPGLLLAVLGGADVLAFEIIWTLLVVGAQTALGVAVALLLQRRGIAFKGWWRALFIVPVAVPEFVGALTWLHLTEPTNGWLSLGLGRELEWVRDPELSLLVLTLAAVWMGWPLLLLAASASLNLIPPDVYEAAAIDGANRWQRFAAVTGPMLFPLLAPALIVRAIFAFNQFYLFYVFGYFTQGQLPLGTLASFSYFVFSPTFGGQFAVSAAINLLIVATLTVFVLLFNRWTKAAEGVTYA